MNDYKVEFSYLRNGRRVYEVDFVQSGFAANAADEIRRSYSDAPSLRIERVWLDTGCAWEVREFDY